jgi:hypothetical protein
LATLAIWRWVEQEASCKLQAISSKLLNTGVETIEKERLMNENLLLMLKIKYYNDKQ